MLDIADFAVATRDAMKEITLSVVDFKVPLIALQH
jgi:hypothetical protein